MSLTTLSEPWDLTFDNMPDDAFPDGMRLSTDCVCRRLIEPLDPDRYHAFPEALSRRGHGMERVLQEWLREKFGVEAIREVVVPWEHGESHLDLLLPPSDAFDSDGRHVAVELKVNVNAQVKTENVAQVRRQQFAMERAIASGKTLRAPLRGPDGWTWQVVDASVYEDAHWIVLVVDPTTWRIPDPRGVTVKMTDEHRAELEAEWQVMAEFMSRPASRMRYDIEWPSRMPACTCGKCFVPTLEELDGKLVEHAALYNEAQKDEAFAKAEKDHHAGFLKSQLSQGVPPERGQSWVGGGWKVTLSKANAKGNRTLYVNASDAKPSPQL